jgi:hypothetical protein
MQALDRINVNADARHNDKLLVANLVSVGKREKVVIGREGLTLSP